MMKSDLHTTPGTTTGTRAAAPSRRTAPARPSPLHLGSRLRDVVDGVIARSSLVSNAPVLDVRDFAWTAALRHDWTAIRDEARAVASAGAWRSYPLWDHGRSVDDHLARCPRTRTAIARIPALHAACFATLGAGAHLPPRRGRSKGLISCHLALAVPRDGDVRMRVHDRVVRWAEGETLVFDDSYDHEVWNGASAAQVVLLIRFERPLRRPGKWLANLLLRATKRPAPGE